MWSTPSEAAFETIARDPPVRTQGIPDALSTHARLGQGLRRLYEPIIDGRSEQLDYVLVLLNQASSSEPDYPSPCAT
ncbi:MAG: hypothetical protein NVS2B5_10680 [Beijerinckiaceae bacterium]